MNIHFECGDNKEKTYTTIYEQNKKPFEKLLIHFNVHYLSDIYVVDTESFDKVCWKLEEKLFGFSQKKHSEITTMGRCMEVADPKYRQLLIIKDMILIPMMIGLNDTEFWNSIDNEKTKLIVQQNFYHELYHLQEMEMRERVGLMIIDAHPSLFEDSKKVWTEYYAERKSVDFYCKKDQESLNMEQKLVSAIKETDEQNIGTLLYYLTHFLAIKSESTDKEIAKDLRGICIFEQHIEYIWEYNIILKEMYEIFPNITFKNIAKIEEVLKRILYN